MPGHEQSASVFFLPSLMRSSGAGEQCHLARNKGGCAFLFVREVLFLPARLKK